MRYSYQDFQNLLPSLSWTPLELAEKLSRIGHETEVKTDQRLNVTLTTNRKDCQKLEYLLFDLSAIFPELRTNEPLITFGHASEIAVTVEEVNKLLGSRISKEDFQKLSQLGFQLSDRGVRSPDFRTDIATKADIAEELTRLLGFEAIHLEELSKLEVKASSDYDAVLSMKLALQSLGFSENQSYSFAKEGSLALKNPFSQDEPFLRKTLLVGLLKTLAKNPFLKRAMFFEIGDVYLPSETTKLGVLVSGYKNVETINQQLTEQFGTEIILEKVAVAPLADNEVKQPNVYWTEVELSNLKISPKPAPIFTLKKFQPISKFPPLVRDITLGQKLEAVEAIAKSFDNLLLIEQIDSYTNPETGQSNQTYRMMFQKMESSFTESEINDIDAQLNEHFHLKN